MAVALPNRATISDDDRDSTAAQKDGYESFRVGRSSPRKRARGAARTRGAAFAPGPDSCLLWRSLLEAHRVALPPDSRNRIFQDRRPRCTESVVWWLPDTQHR